MITHQLINEFLICLYKRHTEKHGDGIGNLSSTSFNIMDHSFMDELPSLKHNQDDGSFKNLTSTLLRELKERGYADGQNMEYHLTPEGYAEAIRLMHPYVNFFVNHWKFLVMAAIGLIASVTAVLTLLQCP